MTSAKPLKVVVDELKGRCFVADRDVEAGEILLQARPYASVADSEHQHQVCASSMAIAFENDKNDDWVYGGSGIPGEAIYAHPAFEQRDWDKYRQFEAPFFANVVFKEGVYHPNIFAKDGAREAFLPNYANLSHYALDYTRLVVRVLINRFSEWHGGASSVSFSDAWALCSNFECFERNKVLEFARAARVLTRFVYDMLLPLIEPQRRDEFLAEFLPKASIKLAHEELVHLAASTALELMDPLPPSSVITGAIPIDTASAGYLGLFASIIELVAKEECNSFGLYTFGLQGSKAERQPFALALFLEPVFFNHSCCPNVSYVTRPVYSSDALQVVDLELVFFAAEKIKAGTELCITYVALEPPAQFMKVESGEEFPGDKRRSVLRDTFFFNCACRRCVIEQSGNKLKADVLRKWLYNLMCGHEGCHGWFVPEPLTKAKIVQSPSSKESLFVLNEQSLSSKESQSVWECEACHRQETFKLCNLCVSI